MAAEQWSHAEAVIINNDNRTKLGVTAQGATPAVHIRTTARPVIVGYADGGAGHAALKLAGAEAELRKAPLVVLHELIGSEHPDRYGPGANPMVTHREVTRRISDAVRPEVPASVDISVELVTGSAATEIAVASDSAELVVVGVTTRHALTAVVLDTVTLQVVNRASSPVLIVPECAADTPIRQIVCGVDRSDGSVVALNWAATEAAKRGVILMVVELDPVIRGPRRLAAGDSPLTTWVRANLPSVASTVTCSTEFGVHKLAERLLDIAAARHAMLVIGTQQDPFRPARSVARVASSQTRVPVVLVPQTWQPSPLS